MHRLTGWIVAGSALAIAACGGATPEPVEPDSVDPEPVAQPEETPFPRQTSLPAGPRAVISIEMAAIRQTPLFALLSQAMNGDDPADRIGRALLERTEQVRMGVYGDEPEMVIIATGPLEGLVERAVAEEHQRGNDPTPVDRLGLSSYYLDDDMVVCQTASDTVVLTYPGQLNEVLRGAAGQQPSFGLPPRMQELLERSAIRGAPMSLLFRTPEGRGSDPLAELLHEAEWGGVAARFEGERLVVVGHARVASPARAGELRAALATAAQEAEAPQASFQSALRGASIRDNGPWVEVEMNMAPDDLGSLFALIAPLGD